MQTILTFGKCIAASLSKPLAVLYGEVECQKGCVCGHRL